MGGKVRLTSLLADVAKLEDGVVILGNKVRLTSLLADIAELEDGEPSRLARGLGGKVRLM